MRAVNAASQPAGTSRPARIDTIIKMERGSLIREYEIHEPLGQGGVGRVYKAWNRITSRYEALKVLREGELDDAESRARFEREVQVLGGLDHPNIAALRTAFYERNRLFLVMEFVEGSDLDRLIRNGPIPVGEAVNWILQVLSALDFAHRRNVVHRDIKPSNVRVCPSGAAKLLDFGLAKSTHMPQLTQNNIVMGTPLYMSPEVWDGDPGDQRSDLYSVGILLYELVTGHTPFQGATTARIKALHRTATPASALEVVPALSAALDHVILKAIKKDPAERFPSAHAFMQALQDTVRVPEVSTRRTVVEVANESLPESDDATRRTTRTPIPTPGNPVTLVVSQTEMGAYRTIGQAVEAAKDGDRIMVRPGVYREAILLERSLELLADGPAGICIVESPSGPCLVSRAPGGLLRGFTLRTVAGPKSGVRFVIGIERGELELLDCEVSSDSGSGVWVTGSSASPRIRGTRIHDCARAGIVLSDKATGFIEDCEIFGTGMAAVEISAEAAPTVRRSTLRDGNQSGVYFHSRAAGILEDCDIFGNGLSGVAIRGESNPTVRRCKGHDNKQCGVLVYEKGAGIIEDCDIYGNKLAGVEIREASNTIVRRSKIREGRRQGVFVWKKASGMIEDCDIYGNQLAGIEIRTEANPIVWRTKIHDGEYCGVYATERCTGVLEQCEIFANRYGGFWVTGHGNPTIRRSKIYDGKQGGIFVHSHGAGIVEDCEIFGNTLSGIEIRDKSNPIVRRSKIYHGKQHGVLVHQKGAGIIEDCEIFGHAFANLYIKEKANPTIRRCKIHTSESTALSVSEKGTAVIEDCEIFESSTGLWIGGKANATVRRSRVHNCGGWGIWLEQGGTGSVEDSEISENGFGVEIRAATARLQRCSIGKNQEAVSVSQKGSAKIENCDLRSNTSGSVWVDSSSSVTKRDNQE